MITHDNKKKIIEKFAKHNKDNGSASVQIALLTDRINALTEHLKGHAKDYHSRRGLVKLVGQRSMLLNYLRDNDPEQYTKITKDLGIRQQKTAA